MRVIDELGDYFTAEIEKRRAKPGPDLVSALVAAHDEGEVMSAADLLSFITLLLLAGNETTTNLIGNGTLALGRNPDQFDALKRNPAMLPRAIEEMLRYDGPVQSTVRFTKEPVQLGGAEIPAGAFALMIVAAANRDPAQFKDPEKFDITRDPERSRGVRRRNPFLHRRAAGADGGAHRVRGDARALPAAAAERSRDETDLQRIVFSARPRIAADGDRLNLMTDPATKLDAEPSKPVLQPRTRTARASASGSSAGRRRSPSGSAGCSGSRQPRDFSINTIARC